MSISCRELTKIYGNQKALNEVSFSVGKGEIVGLLGPNGAGKSTLMKIITGFIRKTSGDISVNGLNPETELMSIKRQIGYLPENNPLYLDFYVKEYLEFISRIYKLDNKNSRIDETIDLVGLTPEKSKKIGALSKGYRQRVGLAQALLPDPAILILDEPTTGLDPNQIIEIRDVIKKTGEDKTVLLSTHIMQEVEAICEKAIIINKGKLIAFEKVDNLPVALSENSSCIHVEFKSEVMPEVFNTISSIQKISTSDKKTYLFYCSPDKDPREDIFKLAVEKNLVILAMQKEKQDLAGIFHQLTSAN